MNGAGGYRPYPAYKDSGVEWLGEVPEHWEIKRSKAVLTLSKEKNDDEPVGEMLSVSGYRGVEQKEYDFEERKRTVDELADYRVVRKGQLVVNTMWLNYSGLGVSRLEGYVSPAYRCYFVKPDIDGEFLHHLMRSSVYIGRYSALLYGIRPNSLQIKNHDWDSLEILIPPQSEQRAIAAFLERKTAEIDALIAAKERLIALLREKRAALITQAVTKGLDPDASLKDSGVEWLGEVPEHWEVRPLKANAKLQTGLALGKKYPADVKFVTRPYLRVANVQDGYLDLNDITYVDVPENEIPRYELQRSDVVVTEGGDFDKLGRGYVWDAQIEGCLHQNHIFAVQTDRSALNPHYLAAVTATAYGRAYFTATSVQSTNLASTNSRKLMNFTLPIPPLGEQKAILEALEAMTNGLDSIIGSIRDGILRLQEYRTALISAAVTGKIDVREAA